MKSSAFYELDKVLKNKKNDSKIEEFIEKYSVEDLLMAFKGNGFGVNAFPGSESYKDYSRIRPRVYAKAAKQQKENLINEYDVDIKTLNVLFDDYYSKDEFEVVKQVADDKKIYAFLIALELYIRGLIDLKYNKGKNREFYGDIDIQKDINGKIIGVEELTDNQFIDSIDYTLQQASKVVQSFIFYGYLYTKNEFVCCSFDDNIEWDDIVKSINYFHLIDERNVIFDCFEDWKFGNYKLIQEDDYNIGIIPNDIEDLVNERIEIQRFESSRLSSLNNSEDEKNEYFMSKSLAPEGFIDKAEKVSYDEYLEYFSAKNLDYKINGIEIVKWLRAYAVVRYFNEDFLNNNELANVGKPNKWLYISTIDDWVKAFKNFGIDDLSSRKICDKFIFKKNSVDCFDSPFIEIDGKIITIPSHASRIQSVMALMSLATKEGLNIAFKGYCFEDRVLNDLRENQIIATSVKRKYNNKEYQCDVVFVLGKDLFLCECKHTAQPITQRKRYEFYNIVIPEHIKQTNRICDFYSLNIDCVLDELNQKAEHKYSLEWKPKRIYRMLIYSCKLARKLDIDGVIVTDYTVFTTFLYKRLPTFFMNGKPIMQLNPPNMKGALNGKPTTNKLLNFIDNPWQRGFQKEIIKITDQVVPINNIFLHKKKADRTIDNFYSLK
ncbi:MAG: hypothetical protein PHG06_06840 [Parabacteroides sp.]|nr:hypothetical protein [Tissierellia bacterium]MDD4590136.1 hypothetical protein [Parabacteroides sp.]